MWQDDVHACDSVGDLRMASVVKLYCARKEEQSESLYMIVIPCRTSFHTQRREERKLSER